MSSQNFEAPQEIETAYRDGVLALDLEQSTQYHGLLGLIPGWNVARMMTPRRNKLAMVAGVALTGVATLGAVTNNSIEMSGSLSDGEMSSAIKKFELQNDVLAGTATFTDNSTAKLKVNVKAKIIGHSIDWIAPDTDSTLTNNCVGQFQELIKPEAISRDVSGGKAHFGVDMSQVYINTYRPVPCNYDQDDDDEHVLYQNLGAFLDGVSNIPFVDDSKIPKLDVMQHDVDNNAATTMDMESQKQTVDTCGPQMVPVLEDSAKAAVSQLASTMTGIPTDKIDVTVKNSDQIQWHPANKTVSALESQYLEVEPKVGDFKFTKLQCDTKHMQIIGKEKK